MGRNWCKDSLLKVNLQWNRKSISWITALPHQDRWPQSEEVRQSKVKLYGPCVVVIYLFRSRQRWRLLSEMSSQSCHLDQDRTPRGRSNSVEHKRFAQANLKDLVGDVGYAKKPSELLSPHLQKRNMLVLEVNIARFHTKKMRGSATLLCHWMWSQEWSSSRGTSFQWFFKAQLKSCTITQWQQVLRLAYCQLTLSTWKIHTRQWPQFWRLSNIINTNG